jgi:hypothetical protein
VSAETPQIEAGFPAYVRNLLIGSFLVALLPVLSLLGAMAFHNLYLLQFVHVITGGTWTGFDIFMGVILARIMKAMDLPVRVEVAKRLTPATFFILPSLSATAITSGIYLAQQLGKFDLTSPWIIGAGVVVIILTLQGFGIFTPNGLRIFLELAKKNPDIKKIASLNMINIRLAGSQAVFQVIIILIMAHLAVY